MSSGGQSPPPLDAITLGHLAGCQGIEPRCPVLETRLIPDRDPKVGASSSELDNRFLSVREADELAKTGFAPVLPSGIGPASPALQAGAITRSATGAKSWPRQDQGRLCPATGIVDYLIVKDHPRPSPEWLPRFNCALADFIIRVDLSRSWRRPSLPCQACEPRNEKSRRGRLHLGGFPENL
jgi:hypothetical protein